MHRQVLEKQARKSSVGCAVVPVGALMKRINRVLVKDGEQLHRSRGFYHQGQGPYFDSNFGEFYILDIGSSYLMGAHLNLEGLGRELGVLRRWESLSDE